MCDAIITNALFSLKLLQKITLLIVESPDGYYAHKNPKPIDIALSWLD